MPPGTHNIPNYLQKPSKIEPNTYKNNPESGIPIPKPLRSRGRRQRRSLKIYKKNTILQVWGQNSTHHSLFILILVTTHSLYFILETLYSLSLYCPLPTPTTLSLSFEDEVFVEPLVFRPYHYDCENNVCVCI